MQQLEVQQAALNSRLDSMTFTIKSSQDKNAGAICDMRSTTHGFLTELISVVGQQFGKLQADLKQSQADEIKVSCCSHAPPQQHFPILPCTACCSLQVPISCNRMSNGDGSWHLARVLQCLRI